MEIKTWIKYEESYLPPRCKKLRYRECEEYVNLVLKEVEYSKVQLAFEDNSYDGKGKIYFFHNKLWAKAKITDICASSDEDKYITPLEALIYWREHSSRYFPRSWRDGEHPDKRHMLRIARKELRDFLLIGGELYKTINQPVYVVDFVDSFGIGYTYRGVIMYCEYDYVRNEKKYFPVTEPAAVIEYANSLAAKHGCIKDIGKFKPFIIVHMPELVNFKSKTTNV